LWNVWYYASIVLTLYAFAGDLTSVFDPERKSPDEHDTLDELLDEVKESFNDFQNTFEEVKNMTPRIPCSKSVGESFMKY
jgi:hypothetical protein